MKRGPVTGRQADRCELCGHLVRFHRQPAKAPGVMCSVCTDPMLVWHRFVEPKESEQ